MQNYWNKRKRLHKEKSSSSTGLDWNINMAAVSLFRNTSMVSVTSRRSILKIEAINFKVMGQLFKRSLARV